MHQENTQHSGALIGAMREAGWAMRGIASIVILTFGGLVTAPAVAAVKQEAQKIQWHKTEEGHGAKLSAKLDEVHKLLTRFVSQGKQKTLAMADVSDQHSQVHGLISDLNDLDKGAMDDFAATEAHIQAHHLPAEIEQRQQQAMKTYRARMDGLMTELKAADGAKDSATFQQHLADAEVQLDKAQVQSFHEKFDPKHLPFSVSKPTSQKPRLSKKDYLAHPVMPPKRVQVAANGSLAGIVSMADLSATVPSNPGDPSYLAPTDDVQITPAIQAEAKALNNDPVQIYNWVHNNVEYIPTYGSIQGSDMTLQTLKGNDFDQASLLIALLRAANIPSRYVYGTIQVPIAQVENWVGGVTDPNAALNLLGQGGVPVTGLTQGGQIKYAQMEHIWVEAWVNFIPSRAAKSGTGNTWVPMDASFKQYAYTQAMNPLQAVPFDSNSVTQLYINTANINSAAGSISNVNQSYLRQQFTTYQQQALAYVTSLPSGTALSQVIGSKVIQANNKSILSAALPYTLLSIGVRETSIPSTLRAQFEYELDDSSGQQIFSYTQDTPILASSLVALSFAAATDADQQLLNSYAPQPNADGSPITFSQFPSSLPGYLINLIPQLTINGQVVEQGSALPMGSAIQSQKGYWSPKNGWVLSNKPIIVGQYQAIGLDLQGVSIVQLTRIQSALQKTYAALQNNSVSSLTKDDIVGMPLQSTLLSFFAVNDAQDVISSRMSSVVSYRAPSFGTYSTVVQSIAVWGVPTTVVFPGYLMDIDHSENYVRSMDNDASKTVSYVEMIGSRLSSNEGRIPEQDFSNSDYPVQDISSGDALSIALSQGQQVFVIDSNNIATTLPQLNQSADVLQRIQDVVNGGMQVTISQSSITVNGFNIVGYLIIDPTTGSGAYEISGHANGVQVLEKTPDAADVYSSVSMKYGNTFSFLNITDDMKFFLGKLGWIGAALSFVDLLYGGCGTIASIALAGFDAFMGAFASAFAYCIANAIIASFLLGPFAGILLLAGLVILAGLFINGLVQMETGVCQIVDWYVDGKI